MMKKILLSAGMIFCVFAAKAQIDLNKVVPENPNVASLMKASLTPVTEYAGLPNVNIPIYTVNQDNMSVPISLSYHTGGIKVGEESGSVGLGWTLNAGGIIHRTINGFPDFGESFNNIGYFVGSEPIPDPVVTTSPINGGIYLDLSQNAFIRATSNCEFPVNGSLLEYNNILENDNNRPDNLPDTYSFNFNGYSGSFVMRKDGTIYMLEKNNIYIKWQTVNGAYAGTNYSFIITTEDGTKHYFDHTGRTWPEADGGISYISTWYLTKSVSTTNGVVNYEYEKNMSTDLNRTKSYPLKTFVQALYVNEGQGGGTGFLNSAGPQSEIDDVYLTKIKFSKNQASEGQVVFNYSDTGVTTRQDIPNAFYLKNIEVFDFNFNLLKIEQHDFLYSYFGNASANSGSLITGDYSEVTGQGGLNNPHLNLRLKLESVISNGRSHEFSYHDSNIIPNKTSMSQDYWGFYNGLQNSNSFIGIGNSGFGNLPNFWKAKRYPIESKAKLFSLKRITYPTKGFTDFDFESNTYNTSFTSIPTQTTPPPATVPKSDFLQTSGGGTVLEKIIEPKGENGIIKINLAIYGSNVNKTCSRCNDGCDNNSYPNLQSHPFDFGSDMYVKYTANSTGEGFTRYFYIEDAIDQFTCNGTVFQSVEFSLGSGPPNGGYTFEVYFNDYNGLYSGMAQAVVEWDEVEQGDSGDGDYAKFALGGGLRIKNITDYDYTNKPVKKRNFNYHYKQTIAGEQVEKSYGLLKEVPENHLESPLHPYLYSPGNPPVGASLVARAYSHNGYSKDFGSYVGYDQVTMTFEDKLGLDNGKTTSKFFNNQDFQIMNNLGIPFFPSMHKFPTIRLPHNGKIYRQEHHKRNSDDSYSLISATDNDYIINKVVDAEDFDYQELFRTSDYLLTAKYQYITDLTLNNNCLHATFQFHPLYVTLIELASQTQTTYDINGENPVVSEQKFYYESPNHFQATTVENKKSDERIQITKTRYPDDIQTSTTLYDNSNIAGGELLNYNAISLLKSIKSENSTNLNRVAEPVQVETYENINGVEKLLSIQRNTFKIFETTGFVLPDFVETAKGTSVLEERIRYHKYDNYGNPIEVSKTDGIHICYVWGYNDEYPIAKIENATFEIGKVTTITNTQLAFIANAMTATIDEKTTSTEENLRSELQLLRDGFPDAMITTYTYNPLIGVTSVTDPKGYIIYYDYDDHNRLKSVKDASGNLITDYDYQYKTNQ